jgi:hypothetical protein
MRTSFKICSLSFVLMSTAVLLAQASKWPVIQPLEEKRDFINPGQNNADTPYVAFIKDSGGLPIYKLECHNGNYEDESQMNFSGDFQCALFVVEGTTRTSGNLLAADTKDELSTDWWNRGRMRAAQLRGECLRYPDYSTDRRFKLRGMLLTLRFTDIQWRGRSGQNSPHLARFTFIFKAIPDNSARSPRAGTVTGPKPPATCYP